MTFNRSLLKEKRELYMSNKSEYIIFALKKLKDIIFLVLRSKMSVSWGKVRLVGQFDILAWDNLFSSQLRLVGQFVLRSCPTGRTPVYRQNR